MTNLCAVSIDEQNHQARQDDTDAYFEAIQARIELTMAAPSGIFYHLSKQNVFDALCEIDFDAVVNAMESKQYEIAGTALNSLLFAYFHAKAKDEAETYVENAYCQKCYGAGCPSCNW